jgi:hypothetical protein
LRLLLPQNGDRDAIGAEFTAYAGDRQWWGAVQPATSYLTSHDPVAHVGLGDVATLDRIEVKWPDGTRERFAISGVDRVWDLRQGQGTALGEGGP